MYVNGMLYRKKIDKIQKNRQTRSFPVKVGGDKLQGLKSLVQRINVYYNGTLAPIESVDMPLLNVANQDQSTVLGCSVARPISNLVELLDLNLQGDANYDPNVSKVQLAVIPERQVKLIHCHDMMGGYLGYEKDPSGASSSNHYTFNYWQLVDIFIYFTHNRISIPPVGWIDASHRNGTKIMGTFITEWEGGVMDACRVVDGPTLETGHQVFVDKLVAVAKYYRFDGWFINIESNLPSADYATKYATFLKTLTDRMHQELPGSLVIWYDSVIDNGSLVWQNELNDRNKMFFDCCDGIFLNYKWNESMLKNSSIIAGQQRTTQVYVGTDVWGRGTFGGGELNSYIGIDMAIKYNMSSALFAPAWTFERNESSSRNHRAKDASLWVGGGLYSNLVKNGSCTHGLDGWTVDIVEGGWGTCQNGLGSDGKAFISSHKWSKMCQDIENWAGHYGMRVTGIDVHLVGAQRQKLETSVLSRSGERVSSTSLPFTTHFNQGKGTKYHRDGAIVGQSEWLNLSDQDTAGCVEYGPSEGSDLVERRISYSDAYQGGSSVNIVGKIGYTPENQAGKDNSKYYSCTLYNVDIAVEKDKMLEVTYSWKLNNYTKGSVMVVLKCDKETVFILGDGQPVKRESKNNGWMVDTYIVPMTPVDRIKEIKLLCLNHQANDTLFDASIGVVNQ
eukprot:gene15681-18635_t